MAKRILVIDDQESMLNIVAQMLRNKGFEVSTALNGEEGFNVFIQDPNSFNLILADVNMPKLDGFEFLKKIKSKYKLPPVIFVTGMNEDVIKVVGEEYKVDGIINKPFVVEDALEVINEALQIGS
ncbi:hypothetical protein A3H09_00335 [Candidatus Falkowbacteria bacterium RIFCSPLOWO2_12_FULL_45_13]|uniref:Response regulatory domain-containing protein n=2 Tax=Bacteria TaxID=2 RepID=A0A1F4RB19_UNCSA|nr:MAG: hypothetical protein A3J44_00895 [candidate division WOR-1 bacterium RIFCSPHIGHO2_02_FULL_45_12]OGC05316.1 MAG: hypothetical protein A3H38_02625 [candidate division WOR-1 bacterium RIFCSPLOWO2_02_FULL_46_20]OGF32127.1 MAG: hypothetical protein A3H09_00335 [Candidatus Falkowbacteria bacterium RIFCSPLOWO2_12_FULL_45_13]